MEETMAKVFLRSLKEGKVKPQESLGEMDLSWSTDGIFVGVDADSNGDLMVIWYDLMGSNGDSKEDLMVIQTYVYGDFINGISFV